MQAMRSALAAVAGQSEWPNLHPREDALRQPVGRIEDLRLAACRRLDRAQGLGPLIIDRGAHLKPAAGLDHAAQDKEAGPEALGGDSAMMRIGDVPLAVKEGEQGR